MESTLFASTSSTSAQSLTILRSYHNLINSQTLNLTILVSIVPQLQPQLRPQFWPQPAVQQVHEAVGPGVYKIPRK